MHTFIIKVVFAYMLLPQTGAMIGILILLITFVIVMRDKNLKNNMKMAFSRALISFLVIYITAIYFNIHATIEQSEFVLKTIVSCYIFFGIFLTTLVLFITKYKYLSSFNEFVEKVKTDKPRFLIFYYLFLLSGIAITFLVPFSPGKAEIIYFNPPFWYIVFIFAILIIFLIYPIKIIWEFLGKVSMRKITSILYFISFFYMIMISAFVGLVYITTYKKDFFGIIYPVQGVLFLISAIYYRKTKILWEEHEDKKEKTKKTEEEKEKTMLEEGTIYLVEEKFPKRVYDVFRKQTRKNSLCLTRKFPEELKKEITAKNMIWISESSSEKIENTPPTNLARILGIMKNFITDEEKAIVIIDDLNYLIFQNKFPSVYKIINSLAEIVVVARAIVIISVDVAQLTKKERIMLERECEVVP